MYNVGSITRGHMRVAQELLSLKRFGFSWFALLVTQMESLKVIMILIILIMVLFQRKGRISDVRLSLIGI